MRKYSELLPSYLEGENIRNHSALLEYTDKKLDTLVDLIRSWSTLNRPVLVEKVQTELNVASYTVYINVQGSIREVSVTVGDDTSTYNYMEDECVTSLSLPFEDIVDDEHLSVYTSVYVRVETYDDIVYEKSYPENDTPMGNSADHDEFLDLLGGLIGIPRRRYMDWVSSSSDMAGDLALTFPSFFAKYDGEGVMVAGTEDDWYYLQRLLYFIGHYGRDFLPALMMKILYEWEHTVVYTLYNRKTSTTPEIRSSFYQIISDDTSTYVNIDDTQRDAKIREYDILTRPSYVAYKSSTTLSLRNLALTSYPNRVDVQYRLLGAGDIRVDYAPILVTPHIVGGVDLEARTVDTTSLYSGGWYTLTNAGLGPGVYTLKMQYMGEYEFLPSNSVTTSQVTVGEDYEYFVFTNWKYALHSGSKVWEELRRIPQLLSDGSVGMGRGYVMALPSFYSGWLEGTTGFVVRCTFRYTDQWAEIGVSRLHKVSTESVSPQEMRLNLYNILGEAGYDIEHLFEFEFNAEEKIARAYIDGTLIREKNIATIQDIWYLWGYDGDVVDGLRFYDMDIVHIADRVNTVPSTSITWDGTGGYVTVPPTTGASSANVRCNGVQVIDTQIPNRPLTVPLPITSLITQDNTVRIKKTTTISGTTLSKKQWYTIRNNQINQYIQNTTTTDTSGDTGTRTNSTQDGSNVVLGQRTDTIHKQKISRNKSYIIQVLQNNRYLRLGVYKKQGNDYIVHSYKTLANMGATSNPNTTIIYELSHTGNTLNIKAKTNNGDYYPDTATITLPNGDYYFGFYTTTTTEQVQCIVEQEPCAEPVPPTPTINLYGKGQTIPWSTTQWTTIEINAEAEAHCNYTKRNAILKQLPLTGDFTLILHIQASHNQSWNWGLIPSQSDYSNPAMKVSKGDTLNTNTSIATMFDHGSGVWDTTVEVTITRSGTSYTLEYNGNSYSFTGSTDTLYLWMDKTGSGNLFLTYIETTATMQ